MVLPFALGGISKQIVGQAVHLCRYCFLEIISSIFLFFLSLPYLMIGSLRQLLPVLSLSFVKSYDHHFFI